MKLKTHKPANTIQNGWTQVGITLTTGTTQFGGQTNGALLCGITRHGNKEQKHLQVSQSVQERPDPTHGGSISMFGVLTCEWSVGDERQQNFNWVQFELMDGHKIWDTMDSEQTEAAIGVTMCLDGLENLAREFALTGALPRGFLLVLDRDRVGSPVLGRCSRLPAHGEVVPL